MSQWTVFSVQPQREFKAAADYQRAGIESIVPTETRWRRVSNASRKRKSFEVPSYRGYLVAGTEDRASRFVGQRIGHLTPTDVERFRTLSNKETVRPDRNGLHIGDDVLVNVGAFAEMTGKIAAFRGAIALLSTQLLGSERTVSVSVYHLTRPPT